VGKLPSWAQKQLTGVTPSGVSKKATGTTGKGVTLPQGKWSERVVDSIKIRSFHDQEDMVVPVPIPIGESEK